MQTLWMRAAQTRATCHCPQCIQTVQGVSKRATASATRHIAKYSTSSTLFYSGIFAAAATWDAGAKKQRREQWDKAIAGVKQELGHRVEAGEAHLHQAHQIALDQDYTDAVGVEATVAYVPDVFTDVEPQKQPAQWPANTGPDLQIHSLPPESIYATQDRKARASTRRWSPKKLETVMLSIDSLQLQLFLQIKQKPNDEWLSTASGAVPVTYRDKMFIPDTDLHALMHGKFDDLRRITQMDSTLSGWSRADRDVPLSHYEQDEHGSFHETAEQLNLSLRDLFRQHDSKVMSTPVLLAKVACNLSLSTAPPNIHTYNTLLLGMSKIEQPRIVNRIICSMRETHLRPNEVSNMAILDHLTATDDAQGFVRWVGLMRGRHQGLALARPDVKITETGSRRLVRVTKQEGREDKIIQLPYPTPNVFGALMRGVLKFSGFETALSICQGMGQEGWGLCMGGLTPLLLDCADRGDWQAGLAVWQQIQKLKWRSTSRAREANVMPEKIPLAAFAAMLRLASGSAQKTVFEDVWAQARRTNAKSMAMLSSLVKDQNDLARQADIARESAATQAAVEHEEELPSLVNLLDALRGPARAPAALEPEPLGHIRGEEEAKGQIEPPFPRSKHNHTAPVMLREQLDGWLQAGHELDDYELGERPMAMYD
ncbi:hypothetical protein LTR86_001486 [Recurvomyces mirabilis]|nr:hypothetical protein LTR86_001486 [Recurvomyces mirabilis]